jgi:hypothetical protein
MRKRKKEWKEKEIDKDKQNICFFLNMCYNYSVRKNLTLFLFIAG